MARGDLEDFVEQAKRTLDNPVVKRAFEHMEKELVEIGRAHV